MKDDKLLAHNPLSADDILSADFYGQGARQSPPLRAEQPLSRTRKPSAKPTHYKVICISMYNQDIEELDAKVAELKRRGWTKANKSQLIRLALSQLDLENLETPRQ